MSMNALQGKSEQALNIQLKVLSPNTRTRARVCHTSYLSRYLILLFSVCFSTKTIAARFSECSGQQFLLQVEVFNNSKWLVKHQLPRKNAGKHCKTNAVDHSTMLLAKDLASQI